MKNLILFFTMFTLAGCGSPKYVQHEPNKAETHEVITEKEVVVDVPVNLPETNHFGTFETEPGTDMTRTWDWDDATTTLEVVNLPTTEHGLDGVVKLGKTNYRVSTTVKAKNYTQAMTITVRDTTELLVVRYPGVDSVFEVDMINKTFLYTVTNDIEPCAADIPAIPPSGSPWWKWLLYAVGLVTLLITVGKRRKTPVSQKLKPA